MRQNSFTATYIYSYPVFSSTGGDTQKKETVEETNMQDTLEKYKLYLAVKYRKKLTRRQYQRIAKDFLRFTDNPVETIAQDDVDRYLAYLNNNYKHNTIAAHRICLRIFLNFLGRHDLTVPLLKYRTVNRDIITRKQINKFIETAKQLGPEEYLITLFIVDVDARPSDIVNAKWSNIKDNRIYFDDSKTGDNYGFMTQRFKQALEMYKQVRPEPKPLYKDYIFISGHKRYKGCRYKGHAGHVRDVIQRIAKKANVHVTPYDLRSSVITEEFNHFVNPKIIQRKARHRNLQTTLKYNHVDDQQLLKYVDTGTIFHDDNQVLLQHKTNVDFDKTILINTLPQDFIEIEDEDNTCLSFSVSFFSDSFFGETASFISGERVFTQSFFTHICFLQLQHSFCSLGFFPLISPPRHNMCFNSIYSQGVG